MVSSSAARPYSFFCRHRPRFQKAPQVEEPQGDGPGAGCPILQARPASITLPRIGLYVSRKRPVNSIFLSCSGSPRGLPRTLLHCCGRLVPRWALRPSHQDLVRRKFPPVPGRFPKPGAGMGVFPSDLDIGMVPKKTLQMCLDVVI